jgi:ribosomal protein L24
VTVEGVNIATKHVKPQNGQSGQIVKAERPIHISNVRIAL